MIFLHDIRYVRLATRNLQEAERFATEIVGLQVVRRGSGSVYLKSDDRDHTLCYIEGDPVRQVVGFELEDPAQMSSVGDELANAGYAVTCGSKEECEQRAVREFIAFEDPSGNLIEVVARPFHSGTRYHASRDAGILGFNHIGLRTLDPSRDEVFWTNVFNARVSDWVGDAALLRLGTVHHSVAMFPSARPGVQHINHQVESVDDVMKSHYFLKEKGVHVEFGPGRHPSSGAMFLYFRGPDGITFEYSVGVGHITPEQEPRHRPRQFPWEPWSICYWGAKPDIPEFNTGPSAAQSSQETPK